VRVVWSPSALRDIHHIYGYIVRFNPHAAEDLARQLIAAGDSLETFPQRGRPVPGTNLREWPLVYPTSFGTGLREITLEFYEFGMGCDGVEPSSASRWSKPASRTRIHDAFAHLPIYGLEDLGFVPRGEAGRFIAERNTAPGGKLPLTTNGGGLSYMHSGMYGMYALQESVRQMRGIASAQIPGAKISVCHGVGGMFAASGTIIMSNEAP
jgi:hypothetical protein